LSSWSANLSRLTTRPGACTAPELALCAASLLAAGPAAAAAEAVSS
jgi:hypothetical protein